MIEAPALPRIGEVRARDIRKLLPHDQRAHELHVLVLGNAGEPPSVQRVTLAQFRRGRGLHIGLLCPACCTARTVLYLVDGHLRCRTCSGHRTRHQQEKRLSSWKTGGLEEDHLHRLFQTGLRTELAKARAARLVGQLVEGDTNRLAALLPRVHAVLRLKPEAS